MPEGQEAAPQPPAPLTALEQLAPKEQLFVLYLTTDPERVGYRAVKKAGWKQNDAAAAVTASRLLKKAKVKAALDEELAKLKKVIRKDGAYIVQRMFDAEGFNMLEIYDEQGHVKPMSEWPKGAGTLVESIKSTIEPQYDLLKKNGDGEHAQVEKLEVKLPSRSKMWELLGRHFGIFKDSLEIKGDLAEAIRKARQRAGR